MLHPFQRRLADAPHTIRAVPAVRLPIECPQVVGVAAHAPGAGRVEVVDQRGDAERRADRHPQMDAIRFPVELQQGTAPEGPGFVDFASTPKQQEESSMLLPNVAKHGPGVEALGFAVHPMEPRQNR